MTEKEIQVAMYLSLNPSMDDRNSQIFISSPMGLFTVWTTQPSAAAFPLHEMIAWYLPTRVLLCLLLCEGHLQKQKAVHPRVLQQSCCVFPCLSCREAIAHLIALDLLVNFISHPGTCLTMKFLLLPLALIIPSFA